MVAKDFEMMVITRAASATVCPIENSLESVLRIRPGNKIKTCCYVMSFKKCLVSPVFNSIWVLLVPIITNGSKKFESPCEGSKGMIVLCAANVM